MKNGIALIVCVVALNSIKLYAQTKADCQELWKQRMALSKEWNDVMFGRASRGGMSDKAVNDKYAPQVSALEKKYYQCEKEAEQAERAARANSKKSITPSSSGSVGWEDTGSPTTNQAVPPSGGNPSQPRSTPPSRGGSPAYANDQDLVFETPEYKALKAQQDAATITNGVVDLLENVQGRQESRNRFNNGLADTRDKVAEVNNQGSNAAQPRDNRGIMQTGQANNQSLLGEQGKESDDEDEKESSNGKNQQLASDHNGSPTNNSASGNLSPQSVPPLSGKTTGFSVDGNTPTYPDPLIYSTVKFVIPLTKAIKSVEVFGKGIDDQHGWPHEIRGGTNGLQTITLQMPVGTYAINAITVFYHNIIKSDSGTGRFDGTGHPVDSEEEDHPYSKNTRVNIPFKATQGQTAVVSINIP